jgi:hypothetical protein
LLWGGGLAELIATVKLSPTSEAVKVGLSFFLVHIHTSLSVWSKAINEKKQDGSTYLGIKLSTISWAVFLHLQKMCVECIQTLLELKAGPRISFVIFNLLMALVYFSP